MYRLSLYNLILQVNGFSILIYVPISQNMINVTYLFFYCNLITFKHLYNNKY